MKLNDKRVLVCDCGGTMTLDGRALAKACGAADEAHVHRWLCRAEIGAFQKAAAAGGELIVACTQEAPHFAAVFEDLIAEAEAAGRPAPETRLGFTNIRERAGWSDEGARAGPKIAALLAEAVLEPPRPAAVSFEAGTALLVLGRDGAALEAAAAVAGRLDVTLILTEAADLVPPARADVVIARGRVAAARGHLGAFEVDLEDLAQAAPNARASLDFEAGAVRTTLPCDQILDLRGGPPLFAAPEKRDGYHHPDPANPALVQAALLKLTDLVGGFEKPRYAAIDPGTCAHSRAGRVGCTRCLDACPAGAIAPDGDHAAVDPYLCGGCGLCAAVCPTGAAANAQPPADALLDRMRTLLSTYREAGGARPRLLVHDLADGQQMIDLAARLGPGLPANVIPLAVTEVGLFGLDALLAGLAYGAERILIQLPARRRAEFEPLGTQVAIAGEIANGLGLGEGRFQLWDGADPEALATDLYALEALPAIAPAGFAAQAGKRARLDLALGHLVDQAPTPIARLDLPAGAPFGRVEVDSPGCTLCLACVGACPVGALTANPDKPQLSFIQSACVQCGLCRATCPESVITLKPELDFSEASRSPRVVKEEEPFECIRCGKPFGTQASIERMIERLSGHSMFQGSDRLELLKMCDDCRVFHQMEQTDHPMAAAPRPKTRTTDDYLREREELRRKAALDMAKRGLKPGNGAG